MKARTSRKGMLSYIFGIEALGAPFMLSGSYAADSLPKSLSFSNKDLQPYEDSAPSQLREPESLPPKGSGPHKTKTEAGLREQTEKEYWCKKALGQRKKR